MEIIPEMDKVIRSFLPTMLDTAGRSECAKGLRDLDPILNIEGVIRAAARLNELTVYIQEESDVIDERWQPLVEDSLFWCEAAVWAAARQDVREFRDHIRRALQPMQAGLQIIGSALH